MENTARVELNSLKNRKKIEILTRIYTVLVQWYDKFERTVQYLTFKKTEVYLNGIKQELIGLNSFTADGTIVKTKKNFCHIRRNHYQSSDLKTRQDSLGSLKTLKNSLYRIENSTDPSNSLFHQIYVTCTSTWTTVVGVWNTIIQCFVGVFVLGFCCLILYGLTWMERLGLLSLFKIKCSAKSFETTWKFIMFFLPLGTYYQYQKLDRRINDLEEQENEDIALLNQRISSANQRIYPSAPPSYAWPGVQWAGNDKSVRNKHLKFLGMAEPEVCVRASKQSDQDEYFSCPEN